MIEVLQKEIRRIIEKLENQIAGEPGPERNARIFFERFLAGIESGNMQAVDAIYAELNQFWLDSVPWCSQLSKDIEKLIIMYGDLRNTSR